MNTLRTLDPLKTAHRTLWGLGDYGLVADTVIPDLGRVVVESCAVRPGDTVLDIAAGTGNAALPAARLGADVTAVDLTDSLLAQCARRAEAEGLTLTCVAGDAESLPLPDDTYDVVLSCVGIMFAPHHDLAADELIRVCRAGGRIGILSWTPSGFVGQMLSETRPFMPAPPSGTQPPPLWGSPDHIESLLNHRVEQLSCTTGSATVDCFATPRDFREFFKTTYGPTIAAYRAIGADADAAHRLDAALDELATRHWSPAGSMSWEYLLVTGIRAP